MGIQFGSETALIRWVIDGDHVWMQPIVNLPEMNVAFRKLLQIFFYKPKNAENPPFVHSQFGNLINVVSLLSSSSNIIKIACMALLKHPYRHDAEHENVSNIYLAQIKIKISKLYYTKQQQWLSHHRAKHTHKSDDPSTIRLNLDSFGNIGTANMQEGLGNAFAKIRPKHFLDVCQRI